MNGWSNRAVLIFILVVILSWLGWLADIGGLSR